MTFPTQVTLDMAQELVIALQADDAAKAEDIIDSMTQIRESELYLQLSSLTENLHQTLDDLNDSTLLMQTKHDIPDATERLQYVIQTTEEASNKTLDEAEQALQSLEFVQSQLDCVVSDEAIEKIKLALALISDKLTSIMLAQSFQDLTGQVLNRVILIITSLEQSLIQLIESSGRDFHAIPDREEDEERKKASEMKGVGPNVTQHSKQDIVGSQDDIDDLLNDLGI